MAIYVDSRSKPKRWRWRKRLKLKTGRVVQGSGTPDVNTRAAAEEMERRWIQEAREGRAWAKQAPTVSEFSRTFLDVYAKGNNKPSEVDSKRSILDKHIIPRMGNIALDDLCLMDIDKMKADMKDSHSGKTINNVLTVLRRMLRVAVDAEVIRSHPPVRAVKSMPPGFDMLSDWELTDLLTAVADDPVTLAGVLLAVDAGLRRGEILGLHWADVDMPAREMVIKWTVYRGKLGPPKGGRSRVAPMTDRLAAALDAIRHDGDMVLVRPGGEQWTKEVMRHKLPKATRASGLGRVIGWHVLRHTFCSRLAARGVAAVEIRDLAGHSSIAITQRYMHTNRKALAAAVRVLDDVERRPVLLLPEKSGLPVQSQQRSNVVRLNAEDPHNQ